MVGCDRCAGDRWLTEAGFALATRSGRRYAVRDHLVYEIPPECEEHPPEVAAAERATAA